MRPSLTSFAVALSIVTIRATAGTAVVDTSQSACYNTTGEITPPAPGQAYYGQDAHFAGNQPAFTLSADGKTVYDRNTSLTWMRSPNMTNQQEFAFGLDPTTGASVNPIRRQFDRITRTLQYSRRASSGLSYALEFSTVLAGWQAAACTESVGLPDASGVQIVTVTVTNAPVSGDLFVRVRAD